ncbi:MAG: sensor histidine kinase [Planctomycetota bacterium]
MDARDRIEWLFEQLDVDFDVARTKLAPLLSNGRAVGVIVFELHYPGDAQLFEEKFRISASMAGTVLDMALARQKQQDFAERFVGLLSKPSDIAELPVKDEEEHTPTVRAEDSLDALAEMAAGAAHELNNPLAVISGRAQLLAEAQDDQETREILRQIYENAREASGIIEDLMTFAEPPRPRATQTNVRKMLDEAVQLTGRKISREYLDAKIEVASDVRDVFVDSAQIVSAVANLIANGVESYGDQPGPIEITADKADAGERVRVVVMDQGCGMDGETLKKATQPFFSARPAGRKRGMGLAYAARFIQLNKGTLTLASEPGSGTTATIHLPEKTS